MRSQWDSPSGWKLSSLTGRPLDEWGLFTVVLWTFQVVDVEQGVSNQLQNVVANLNYLYDDA